MGRQTDERTDLKAARDTSSWCGVYSSEITFKSHNKLQRYGQDTNMLTNGQKFANEWTYRQTNGRTDQKVACDTLSWCGEYIYEIILKSDENLQRYDQDTNMLTNGQKFANEWLYGQTNGRTDLSVARDTSSLCGEYICEIILKSNDKLQRYGQGLYSIYI